MHRVMDDDDSRDAYYAYGVDFIRTAGLLLRTTPSVVFRASILFQRFETSVDAHFRSQYIRPMDMPAYRQTLEADLVRAQRLALQPASPQSSPHMTDATRDNGEEDSDPTALPTGAEYRIPNHAQQEMRTGLVPLVDLRAPLDYCLQHLIDQEDIVYLCAACLLIATKMEDPAIRIRTVVNTCMRVSERRAGVVVNELQKPPTARYEDFKACVVDAEEVVLHQLGFQTFVDSPYKYVLLYLNVLVEPTEASVADAAAAKYLTVPKTSSSRAMQTPSRPSSAALTQWMVRAVQLVNDLPRCRRLVDVASDVLALYAIQQTCPSDLTPPPNWTNVFGVTEATVAVVARVYAAYLKDGLGSRRASDALSEIRTGSTAAPYRTVKEGLEYDGTLKGLKEIRRAVVGRGSGRTSHNTSPAPPSTGDHSSITRSADVATSLPPTKASIEELRELIGSPFGSPLPPLPQVPPQAAGGRRDRTEAHNFANVPKRSRKDPHHDGTE
ncbi:hypothetical protein ABB37_03985 [Leptomonas pyrrhocoris]|uniref:Cyclin N-terminal domain-containing protein n=1 Tax=Leptomonas pyrrhocoris TaxID=157538 RepID=A0A0M9G3T6_LEPPY|nr:hypothetical protein ABB37_03985 [Leptomonas pyrrhocoris]KPA81677.1 hypothetical protein ABB37_03985 [Leptomonas pyrrhocoris]|eukprot:XP_015660116.1 hypothetical protein ABB37_03985 [Leptomonas pyrrhocoris]